MTTTNTARKYRRMAWDDPNAWDEHGILRDGITVSVPTYLIDANAKMSEVYDAARAPRSGAYNRPGFRRPLHQDAAALDARQLAYDQHRHYVENAWRDADTDPDRDDKGVSGFGERGQSGPVEDMSCTVKGNPGGDAAMTTDTRELAYQAYDEGVSRQWQSGKDKPAVRDPLPSRGDGMTAKAAAYQAYDESISQQWRNPTA